MSLLHEPFYRDGLPVFRGRTSYGGGGGGVGDHGVAPPTSETTKRDGINNRGWCLPDVDDVILVDDERLQSELSWGDAGGWALAPTRKEGKEEGRRKMER